MAMTNIKPRTSIPTVKANLTSRTMTFEERQSLIDFWMQRYENAPDMRVRDSYTSQPVRTAGGHGLFIASHHEHADAQISPHDSEHPVNKAFDQRKAELKIESVLATNADKERLGLIQKIEKAAHEHWKYDTLYKESTHGAPDRGWFYARSAKFERDQAMALEDLMTYDRKHGHPVAEAQRDFDKEPVRVQEQYHWLQRDGRPLNSTERSSILTNGLDTTGRDAPVQLTPKASRSQPWFIDNKTQQNIDARVVYEKSLDNEYQKAQAPGVPKATQQVDSVLSVPQEERALTKTRQQIDFIKGPATTQHKEPRMVMGQAIRDAAGVDPNFGRTMIEASKNDRGQQAMEGHMKQVHYRFESVQKKVASDDLKVLPLRQSDVILLRGENEARQVSMGANQTQDRTQVAEAEMTSPKGVEVLQAAVQGQKLGMSRETLAPFAQQLEARRVFHLQVKKTSGPEQVENQKQEVSPPTQTTTPLVKAEPVSDLRLEAALKAQAELKARAVQLETANRQTEAKLSTVKIEVREKGDVVQAYNRVERRLTQQYFEGGSIRETRQAYERDQLMKKVERGEYSKTTNQKQQTPIQSEAKRQQAQKMPMPGGFDKWWSEIKNRANEFKSQAAAFVRGDEIKVPQKQFTTQHNKTSQRPPIPAGPGSLMGQSSSRSSQAKIERTQEQTAKPATRNEMTSEQRMTALRDQISRRPTGPGSVMKQPQSRHGSSLARPQQGPNQQVRIQRPSQNTGLSMDMGR